MILKNNIKNKIKYKKSLIKSMNLKLNNYYKFKIQQTTYKINYFYYMKYTKYLILLQQNNTHSLNSNWTNNNK